MDETKDITEQRIAEIQKLVDKFQADLKEGTSDPDHFITEKKYLHPSRRAFDKRSGMYPQIMEYIPDLFHTKIPSLYPADRF